jgi:deazaflavin-dependent oxidoreductase (nitroreductase family)
MEGLPAEPRDAFVRFWSSLHEATYLITDGRAQSRLLGMTVIRLTTSGRRSGHEHSTMLTAPIVEEGRIVVVASNGGDDRDPQWYRNVLVDRNVSVIHDGAELAMEAQVAQGAERSELWRRIRRVTPVYEIYQRRTARELPVVVFER